MLAASPESNYGRSTRLRTDGGSDPAVETYLSFTVTGLSAPPASALLRIFASTDTRDGPAVYGGATEWTESSITWSNRPPRSTGILDDVWVVPINSWVEFDVTSLVTGEGTYTFVLATNSSDGLDMNSRESASNRPQLVLVLEGASMPSTPTPTATRTQVSGESVIVLAAGDIASCSSTGDEATGELVAGEPGSVLVLGDLAYESGTADEFANCYDPSWGSFKDRTYPVPGNHEYNSDGARGYYEYFGEAAGDPATGYYSFNLGAWHIVALNSNCSRIDGCEAGSAQEQWLRADLAAHPNSCVLAYWHHPLYSSGSHGSDPRMRDMWAALYEYGAEIVLSGHDHLYERFAPQDSLGRLEMEQGIREFVVGTGGKNLYTPGVRQPNSEVIDNNTFGVLQLVLSPGGYEWVFLPAGGGTFTDSGSGSCHDALPSIATAVPPVATDTAQAVTEVPADTTPQPTATAESTTNTPVPVSYSVTRTDGGPNTVSTGYAATFNVCVTVAPSSNVTVFLTASHRTRAAASPESLTFGPGIPLCQVVSLTDRRKTSTFDDTGGQARLDVYSARSGTTFTGLLASGQYLVFPDDV